MAIIDYSNVGVTVGDPVNPVSKSIRRVVLDLPDIFDDKMAEEVLDLSINDLVSPNSLILKSMYEFDLDTEDGVYRLLSLLPILDPEIIKVVMQEIWPGYPVDSEDFVPSFARADIKGYLLDFLEGHGTKEADINSTDESEPDGGAEEPASPAEGGSATTDPAVTGPMDSD